MFLLPVLASSRLLKRILFRIKSTALWVRKRNKYDYIYKRRLSLDRIEEIGKCVAEGEKQILKAVANYQTGLLDPVMTQLSSQVRERK